MSQTSQKTVNNFGKLTRGTSNSTSKGTRTSSSTRAQTSESVRALTNSSNGESREIQRANIAMQITFTVPITNKIPVNPTPC